MFELLAREGQAHELGRHAQLARHLGQDCVSGVSEHDIQSNGLTRERLDENLRRNPQP